MTDGARRDHSDQLLDTLLAAATDRLRSAEPNFDDLARLEANLTDEDIKALDTAGPACIAEIIADEKVIRRPEIFSKPNGPTLMTAMNRGKDGLTDKAREEMERNVGGASCTNGEGDVNNERN